MKNDLYLDSLRFDRFRVIKENKKRINNLNKLKLVGEFHKRNKYNYLNLSDKICDTKDIIIVIDNKDLIIDNLDKVKYLDNKIDNYDDNILFFKKNKFKKSYTKIKDDILYKTYKKIIKIYKYADKYNLDVKDIYITNYNKSDNNNYMLEELDKLITVYLLDEDKRIEFIYDYMCDYLDKEFIEFNLCDFKDNKCVSRRELECHNCHNPLIYGCCYTKGRVCPYLINSKCTIKSLPCKFFTCRYLEKRGIKYRPWNYLIIRLFLSYRQMDILDNSLYTPKEIILEKLQKRKVDYLFNGLRKVTNVVNMFL